MKRLNVILSVLIVLVVVPSFAQKQARRTKPPVAASEDPVKMAKIIVNLVDENQQLRYNAGNLDYNTGVYTTDLEKITTAAGLDSFRTAWGLKNPPKPEVKPDSTKAEKK
jgi:biopolymer transport protein ExbD